MYNVDFEARTCTCRSWQLTSIPCLHAVSGLTRAKEDPYLYVGQCYEVERYHEVYQSAIYGINGADLWGNSLYIPPLPPNFGKDKQVGRPGKARSKDEDEKNNHEKKGKKKADPYKLPRNQGKSRCGTCGTLGHNSRRCPINRPNLRPPNQTNSMSGGNPDTDDEDEILNLLDEDELLNMDNNQLTQDPLSQISQEHNVAAGVAKKLKVNIP